MRSINRDTLGGLVRRAKVRQSVEEIEVLMESALTARNRLMHSFYRQHNIRKFSEEGRMIMMHDLQKHPHDNLRRIQGAYAIGRNRSR
jgi:hypothetical protein